MTIHITWFGVLAVIGGVVLGGILAYVLLALWVMFRWGK